MKQYKNLIASGCSFTSNGMGGAPPTDRSQGGCSYIDDPQEIVGEKSYLALTPGSWSGFLAQKLNVTSMINTASGSHGNILIVHTLLEILNKFPYDPEHTLIVFNLSDPARLDLPCEFNHVDADHTHILWTKNIIDHSYLKLSGSDTKINKIIRLMGIDQVEQFTSNAVELLFTLLEHRKYNFYFMMMKNYINHRYLGPVIEKYKDRLINLSPGISMYDFCQLTNNYISKLDEHPTINGHKLIADAVYSHINALQV
jgi:hypothetical protein